MLTLQQKKVLAEALQGPLYRGNNCWRRGAGKPWLSCQTVSSLQKRGLLRMERVGNEMGMVLTEDGRKVAERASATAARSETRS